MTFRVTDSMLENLVERLNDISKCRYRLGGSYGYTSLEKCSMECTGISMVSQGNTKKELYYQLQLLFDWLNHEQNDVMDYIKNCTHHDVFNLHSIKNEKIDASHIREYEGKYTCLTCKKEFTKQEYEKSIIPKSAKQLRGMRVERKR